MNDFYHVGFTNPAISDYSSANEAASFRSHARSEQDHETQSHAIVHGHLVVLPIMSALF